MTACVVLCCYELQRELKSWKRKDSSLDGYLQTENGSPDKAQGVDHGRDRRSQSRSSSLNGSSDGLLAAESSKLHLADSPTFPARRRGMSERDDEFAKRAHEALLQKKFGIAPSAQ